MHIENMCQSVETLATMMNAEVAKGADGCVEEMAEVADMLKDLNEAVYYATIVKEMKEAKKEEETLLKAGIDPESSRYYSGRRYYYDPIIHGGIPRYYDDNRYYDNTRYYRPFRVYMTDGGNGMNSGNGGNSTSGGSRYYNDNRYSNGQYAPDGDTTRGYSINYPEMYDPMNQFNNNKWRLGSKKGTYPSLESKIDKNLRYYTESKMEHNKGTEEDNSARLKFLEGLLDSVGEVMMDSYDDASAPEQDMIEKKMSDWLSKMK